MPIMTPRTRRSAIHRVGGAVFTVGLLSASLISCGKGDAPATPVVTNSSAAPAKDSLKLELSGGLNRTITNFYEPPKCRWYRHETGDTFNSTMVASVVIDGQKYDFSVGLYVSDVSRRTYPVRSRPSATDPMVQIGFRLNNGTLSPDRWNTQLVEKESDVSGTVNLNADHSGDVDATLSRSKGAAGGPLKIKGSWSCATILGKQ